MSAAVEVDEEAGGRRRYGVRCRLKGWRLGCVGNPHAGPIRVRCEDWLRD